MAKCTARDGTLECVYQQNSIYYLGVPLCAFCERIMEYSELGPDEEGAPAEETQDLIPDDFKSAMQFRWK